MHPQVIIPDRGAIIVPPGATYIDSHVEIPSRPGWSDIEVSLNGGAWGGCFVELANGWVPLCYSGRSGILTGGRPESEAAWRHRRDLLRLSGDGFQLPKVGAYGVLVRDGEQYEAGDPIVVSDVRVRVSRRAQGSKVRGNFYARNFGRRQLLKDVHHSVSYDNVGAATGFNAVSGKTWNHVNVGSSGLYVRALLNWTCVSASTVSTLTYDAVSMLNSVTSKTSNAFQDTINGRCEIFEKVSPNTGSVTVEVIWSVASNQFGGGIGTETYLDVDQSTPSGTPPTPTSGTSNTPSLTFPGTTSGNMVGVCVSVEAKSDAWTSASMPTPSNDGRLYGSNNGLGGSQNGGAQDAASTGSGMTLSWTLPNSVSRRWIMCGCEIRAAGGGGDILMAQSLQ